MDTPDTNFIEILIGAIILGLGLIYLTAHYEGTAKLNEIAIERELGNDNFYEQRAYRTPLSISSEELLTILIGYREYPISIDGVVIAPHDMDYSNYISLIKEGYYRKSYLYDDKQDITMVNYSYAGFGVS